MSILQGYPSVKENWACGVDDPKLFLKQKFNDLVLKCCLCPKGSCVASLIPSVAICKKPGLATSLKVNWVH